MSKTWMTKHQWWLIPGLIAGLIIAGFILLVTTMHNRLSRDYAARARQVWIIQCGDQRYSGTNIKFGDQRIAFNNLAGQRVISYQNCTAVKNKTYEE